ncbi:restriction endonuclease subunit S [Flavobacterium saccharophilum]|uniref:Type I restriction modification DNA specificity domain-containing protein n=1 Tax=Flavobacterium saccharophilum TaxID=29534 RepID=A0A1M7JHG1_9FLAO|nr:restriction endonuclease subunit S [Flavobacterium saccharophilum]SHM51947.1 Type I restriction modification DNA specificity domain-containing protein [Flavobacterium saccharophilum]
MKNWKKVKLGSLLTESKIVSENPNTENRIRVKLNILGVEKRPDIKEKKGATKYYTRKAGQFVYGKQNLHKGAFGIIPKELDNFESSLDIPAFDVNDSCYPEWIFYFFKKGNFYLKLENLAKGVGSKRIHPKQIYQLDIYLPSKEEQRRVLDEIERVEASNQKLIRELQLQEENLAKLRKSIFNDAVQGKLTLEWREQNPTVETVNQLLKKIKVEKEKFFQYNKIKKEKPLPKIPNEKTPFDIPESWSWCKFQDIYNYIEAGKSPKCLPYPAENNQWGVIKISAISWGTFQEQENKTLPLNFSPFVEKEIKPGDFILTRANTRELVARSVIVGENVREKLLLNDKTLRVNVSKFINEEYLNLANNSPYARDHYSKIASGTSDSMKNISRLDISLMNFPIPPFDEQKEIVKKINQLQSNCNQIEYEIISNKKNSEKLMQSVLSELLGDENSSLFSKISIVKRNDIPTREIKYNSKTTNMDLIKLLKENGKLHAEDLWKMSEHYDDKNINDSIDKFYTDLKNKIEIDKTIKESNDDKGYIELV